MRLRKRIFVILTVGSFLVGSEILGFHLLNRDFDKFARRLEPAFQSMSNVVEAATILSNLIKKVVPQAQNIPQQIWGKWLVNRQIPTTTISCWGEAEAKTLLGTEIEYSQEVFRWKDVITTHPIAESKMITAEQFHDDNSGMGSNSSQVTFRQLGIKQKEAMQISIEHPPASITGGTVEIPGDVALVKDQNTIIFSACNVYFEAKRVGIQSPPKKNPDH
jgi:hypothetical protein